ncbi:MAG: EamA family transporter [Candidatus Auribacterota bacterium]|jgi:multidrug transporter EmrE-like cation transporter|uniref:Cation transporter n=1 Tax=Candidatus Auribacter fodinae TaxID=2093366 RepID=A0A3A4QZH4_9BACT|nr:MAG: cation transporter [Candidatus Auribacter fodinae]
MNNYLILSAAIVFNAIANVMIKVGMMKAGKADSLFGMMKNAAFNPAFIFGIFCFVVALGGYSFILSKLNLSIAYPIMTSVGYMLVIFISWLFLKETILWYQVIGFLMIIGGVWLVAQGN